LLNNQEFHYFSGEFTAVGTLSCQLRERVAPEVRVALVEQEEPVVRAALVAQAVPVARAVQVALAVQVARWRMQARRTRRSSLRL
jgi:hypothetical protein